MISPGDVISYLEMCQQEGVSLQRGMNFHLRGDISVILMSLRSNAPYADRIEDDGRILIYEGHDVHKTQETPIPKNVDQPIRNPSGTLTQNGQFYEAVKRHGKEQLKTELVRVYEKIRSGIWVYNGIFELVDAWQEYSNDRKVFKFKLLLTENTERMEEGGESEVELNYNRLVPSYVKMNVWKRDKGKCVICASTTNLHFDHIIPFSKGGSSLVAENVQLLCAKHNIAKRDRIE
ncbi:MAG: HNH endonuclease [Dehalococcoidales bacterium]|nr:MAG: HNH endonuclease [Dehalococcoidales bacterium]